jgi:hypothetical protein
MASSYSTERNDGKEHELKNLAEKESGDNKASMAADAAGH